MKIGEIQREKIADKLEVMSLGRTAEVEETHVELSSCIDAGNEFSLSNASCAGVFRLPASSLRDCQFKCPICTINVASRVT